MLPAENWKVNGVDQLRQENGGFDKKGGLQREFREDKLKDLSKKRGIIKKRTLLRKK
jgi:hypothetical protein